MSTTRVDRLSRTIRIGDTEDSHGNNGPLEITVTLEPVDLTHGQQTVWHQPATAPQHRLSIMGETPTQGGQIQKHMPDVVAFEEGWTAEALDDLIEVWDWWHLNDMRAGCAHVEPVWEDHPRYGYRQPSLDRTPSCPQTGYRYGSAWLIDPLPESVTAKALMFMQSGVWPVITQKNS